MNSFVNQFLAFHSIFGGQQEAAPPNSSASNGGNASVGGEDENSNSPPPPPSSSAGGGNNSDSDQSPTSAVFVGSRGGGKQRRRFRVAVDDGIRTAKVFTDEIDDLCQCTCLICNKNMTSKSLKEHIRKQHKMGPEEYINKFGEIQYTKLTYHRCHLCKRTLKAVVNVISNHLKKCHDLTFQQYRTKFNVFNGIHSGKRKFFIKKNSSSDITSDQTKLKTDKHCQTKQQQINNSTSIYAKLFADATNHMSNTNHVTNSLTNHISNTNNMTSSLTNHMTNTNHVTNSLTNHITHTNHVTNSFNPPNKNSTTNVKAVKQFTSMALLLGNGIDSVDETKVEDLKSTEISLDIERPKFSHLHNQLISSHNQEQSNGQDKTSDFLRNFYFSHFINNFQRLNDTIKRLSNLSEENKLELFNTEIKQVELNRVTNVNDSDKDHDMDDNDNDQMEVSIKEFTPPDSNFNFVQEDGLKQAIKGVVLGELDEYHNNNNNSSPTTANSILDIDNNSLGGVVSQHLQQQWLLGMQNIQNGLQGVEEGIDQDGRVYTNNVKDFCVAQCHLCNKNMTIKSLREHVRHRHNQSIRDYKKVYGDMCYTKITYHRCKFCSKSMKASVSTISTHLKKQHSVSFQDYRALFKIFQDVKRRRRL